MKYMYQEQFNMTIYKNPVQCEGTCITLIHSFILKREYHSSYCTQHVVLNENAFCFAQNCQKTVMFEPSLLRFAFLKPHSTNIGCHFLNKPKKQLLGIKKTLV